MRGEGKERGKGREGEGERWEGRENKRGEIE